MEVCHPRPNDVSHSLLAYVDQKAAINDFAMEPLYVLGFEESG